MLDIIKQYAVRLVVTLIFGFAGPILVKLGISESSLTEFILGLLSGGLSLGVILSMVKHALMTDPVEFQAKVAARARR